MSDLLNYVYLPVNQTDINGIPIQLPMQQIITDNNIYNVNLVEDDNENLGLVWNNNLDQNFTITLPAVKDEENPTFAVIKSEQYDDQNLINSAAELEAAGMVYGIPIQLPMQQIITDNNIYNVNLVEDNENLGLVWNNNLDQNFTITLPAVNDEESSTFALIKSEQYDDQHLISSAAELEAAVNNIPDAEYVFTETEKWPIELLNLPHTSAIRCQNCDKCFPTKYQYQRHQCEYNAANIVLEPVVKGEDIHTMVRVKYECETCKKSFISITNLERHKQSHIKTSSNTCEFCNKTFVSESRLLTHKANYCKKSGEVTKFYPIDVAVWHCVQCDQVFSSKKIGNDHIVNCVNPHINNVQIYIKTENEEDMQQAQVCDNNNDFDANLAKAIKLQPAYFPEYKYIKPNIERIITDTLYQCEFCNRTYVSKTSVRDHQKLHTTVKNYECVFCYTVFNSYCDAVIHWENICCEEADVFFLPKLIYCEYCDKGYKSHDVLYNHKLKKKHYSYKVHPVSEESCKNVIKEKIIVATESVAEKPIEETSTMNGTQNEVGKKRRGRKRTFSKIDFENRVLPFGYKYQCPKCAVVFDDVNTMEIHSNNEHANTYMCHLCGQVLKSGKAFNVHYLAHQSLKRHVCDKCGRSFSQTSHLWQHMRFHQGIKPFACPHEGCKASFTIRPDLKDHIRRVHTRERPFKCSVCNKCFLTGPVYYQHRLTHTNNRRYGCEVCNKRFFRADALNNHRRIHTNERPYICEICGRSFRQKGDRNKHVRTQHVPT